MPYSPQTGHDPLTDMISAIGEPDFAARAAHAICGFLDFELSAMIVHGARSGSRVIYDNFDRTGSRLGLDNYVRFTHRANPMLAARDDIAVCRARDFAIRGGDLGQPFQALLIPEGDEELGFRTTGWPPMLEEVGLYFSGCGGRVELGFYRERSSRPVSADRLEMLGAFGAPIRAAFERNAALEPQAVAIDAPALSPREREVCALLLDGCSTEAIALRLGISRHTVKDHRKSIFRKLDIGTLAELFALRH
ncbi:MAG: helix-turn-helix transcriptional regulator [Sphingobium sp.]